MSDGQKQTTISSEEKNKLINKKTQEHEKACEGIETYKHFKKLDCWTLDEGLKLLINPIEIGEKSTESLNSLFYIDFLIDSSKFHIIETSINRSLPVDGDYEKKLSDYQKMVKRNEIKKSNSNLWYLCYADLKINPFTFLDFIKEKNLYTIPPELKLVRTETSSGEIQYSWANQDSNGLLEIDKVENTDALSGKEKQEYGRLKIEKKTMDSTVKAAIKVGQFVQQKIDKKEQLLKHEIQDLVCEIDKDIPSTRIDFIWRSIPTDFKKGPGRPPKKGK